MKHINNFNSINWDNFDDFEIEEDYPNINFKFYEKMLSNNKNIKVYKKDWNRFVTMMLKTKYKLWGNNQLIKNNDWDECYDEQDETILINNDSWRYYHQDYILISLFNNNSITYEFCDIDENYTNVITFK